MTIADELRGQRAIMRRNQRREYLQFCRTIVRLIDYKTMTQKDIAAALGVTRETVRTWTKDGRTYL